MTKKDYQAIARAIHGARLTPTPAVGPYLVALVRVADDLADVLAAENPRFDRSRFIEACETGRCKGMRPAATVEELVHGREYVKSVRG